MSRRTVDLTAHINETVERGHPGDFSVTLKPLFYDSDRTAGGVRLARPTGRPNTAKYSHYLS